MELSVSLPVYTLPAWVASHTPPYLHLPTAIKVGSHMPPYLHRPTEINYPGPPPKILFDSNCYNKLLFLGDRGGGGGSRGAWILGVVVIVAAAGRSWSSLRSFGREPYVSLPVYTLQAWVGSHMPPYLHLPTEIKVGSHMPPYRPSSRVLSPFFSVSCHMSPYLSTPCRLG